MTEEKKDVKQEEANPSQESVEETKPEAEVSEDVKTPESEDNTGKDVPNDVYVKVREAMKKERTQRKELEQKIANLQSPGNPEEVKENVLELFKKDEFLRENLDLVEGKMAEEGKDLNTALAETKAEFFDRLRKEEPAENKQLKQQRPTATDEPAPTPTEVTLKDALAGKVDVDPRQLQAIRNLMPNQRR